jgi:hypothetical protein
MASRVPVTMLVKLMSRGPIFKKSLFKTEQEYFAAQLLLVWVLTKVTSNQLFITIYQDPLKITSKKSEEQAETAPLLDVTCS